MNNQDAKMSKNKEKKVAIVAEVSEKVEKAKAMVFTDFSGLTHKQLEEFKKEIGKHDAQFAATKNTLLKRALGEQIAGNEDKFQQPTGTLFMYGDVVEPLKLLAKMMKEFEKPSIKFGLLEGKAITEADVKKLATLPNRETLIAQMLGMMNAPIQSLHRALSWNLQKFVMTLDAIAKQKPAEAAAPAATPAPAAPVSEPVAEEDASASSAQEPKAEEAPVAESPAEPVAEQPAEEEATEPVTAEETAEPAQETPAEEPKQE